MIAGREEEEDEVVVDEMVPGGGGARGKEGAAVEVGVTLCLRMVCLYFCRICEEMERVTYSAQAQGA